MTQPYLAYRGAWYEGTIDCRPESAVKVGLDKLEVVGSFCCLGDMLSVGRGCELAVTAHVKPLGRNSWNYCQL